MKEVVLRDYLCGRIKLPELLRDLEGTVERLTPPDVRPAQLKYHIEPLGDDFQLEPEHLLKLIDTLLSGNLSHEALDSISTCLEMSSYFHTAETDEGERVRTVVDWLANPEIEHGLSPAVLLKMKHYLLTGEDTL